MGGGGPGGAGAGVSGRVIFYEISEAAFELGGRSRSPERLTLAAMRLPTAESCWPNAASKAMQAEFKQAENIS